MEEKQYYWFIKSMGENVPFDEKWLVDDESDYQDMASEAAKAYWEKDDGWEDQWPLEVVIIDDEDKEVAKVKVRMESEPCFYGDELEVLTPLSCT